MVGPENKAAFGLGFNVMGYVQVMLGHDGVWRGLLWRRGMSRRHPPSNRRHPHKLEPSRAMRAQPLRRPAGPRRMPDPATRSSISMVMACCRAV